MFGPGVAAQLERGRRILPDAHRGFLGFEEELALVADPEAVIGRLGRAADADGVLVDDFLVRLRVAAFVVHVPAEGLEERIQELLPELRLVVRARQVRLALALEALDQIENDRRRAHAGAPGLRADAGAGELMREESSKGRTVPQARGISRSAGGGEIGTPR